MTQEFQVEVEQEADGRFFAEVMNVPGAMAYGKTREEAITNATEVAKAVRRH